MSLRRLISAILAIVLASVVVPLIVHTPPAAAQTPPVQISEFLAINNTTLTDNTGQFEDWIELHNTTSSTVDVGGWTLADGSDAFVFPAGTQVSSGGYVVIFASGDVTRTTATELHVPFKLSGSGESLTLTDATGVLSQPSWPAPTAYPAQLADDSYGVAQGGQVRYFTDPTPGGANGGGVTGVAEAVTFSVEHGFYSSAQIVVLSTPTPGATIRYTTNGDVPTSSTGTAVPAGSSITVSETTTIRAVAYRDSWITSPVETRSYLFTADIIHQVSPVGWPVGPINGQVLNYEMDPEVVAGNEAAIQASLTSISTISIVTDLDNLLDSTTGIYANPAGRGEEWERQASVELIDPSGAQTGFDIEAGIRIKGGGSRNVANPKHALRLYFRNDYEDTLDYAFFDDEGADEFAILDLRTSNNYGWSWKYSDEGTFIDELWSRDTQAAMGQPYTRSRQHHVYLNGVYWGLYMSMERVSGEYGESYFGGGEDDYDVMKRDSPDRNTEAGDGTDVAWKSLFPLVSDLNVTDAEFEQIATQVDIVNLADYYLLHFWTGDFDGSPTRFWQWNESNNWYGIRNRTGVGSAAKWQFFDHDSEHSLCANFGAEMDNTTPWALTPTLGDDYMAPAYLHEALITNDAYRQVFADRVQLHMLTPGGALTVPEALGRLNARAIEVSPAVEAESARWGDGVQAGAARGRSDWEAAVQVKRDCFVDRLPIVESQLREDGLWPLTDSPTITPGAGSVPFGTDVAIGSAGQTGTLYYTTNGSDPRQTNGTVSASAVLYTGPFTVTGDMTVNVRILGADGQWSPLASATYVLSTPAGPVAMAVNEFNSVSSSKFLGDGLAGDVTNGSDATFGRILGNGGDWFELVVIEDDLDVRGWTVEVWDSSDGVLTRNASLTLANDPALAGLLAGSLITVSEDIADDVSYDPLHGDWHMNLQSNSALAGGYVTAGSQSNFAINNDGTQIAIFDAAGNPVQLRTGEGTVTGVSVSSTEIFKLEGPPTTAISADSTLYGDGSTSTWGLPNVYAAGAATQDLSDLRVMFGDVNCDGRISVVDALYIAQYSVGNRTDTQCPLTDPATQIYAGAADVSGNDRISVQDALFVAQCTAFLPNIFCPEI